MSRLLFRVVVFCFGISLFLLAGCDSGGGASGENRKSGGGDARGESARIGVIGREPTPRSKGTELRGAAADRRVAGDDAPTTEPTVLLYGRVSTTKGDPASSVALALFGYRTDPQDGSSSYGELVRMVTDAKGDYAMRAPIGRYMNLQIRAGIAGLKMPIDVKPLYHGSRPREGLTRLKKDIELEAPAEFSGLVVDEYNKPLAGVPVEVFPEIARARPGDTAADLRIGEAGVTTSTAEGRFSFPGIARGKWHVGAAHPDYAPIFTAMDVPVTSPVTLRFSARGGRVTGHVLHQETGEPAGDIPLRLTTAYYRNWQNLNLYSTKSAADGSFQIDHATTEKLYLMVDVNAESTLGLATRPPEITLKEGETTDVTMLVYPGHTLSGRVFDKDTDEPLAGQFVLAPAPVGENYVLAKPAAPYSEAGRTVKVTSEQTTDMGDLEVSGGGTITGRVVRGAKEEPVPETKVSLSGNSIDLTLERTATTDAQGKFKFKSLPPLNYSVSAQGVSKTTVIDGEKTVEITLQVGGVTMTGTVLRGNTPIVASVIGTGPDGQVSRAYASAGAYTLENLVPGKYQFSVRGQDGKNMKEDETVEVPDEPEFEHDFILPDGAIDLTVVDSNGEPVSDASVALTKKNSGTGVDQNWITRTAGQKRTDVNGKTRFEGLDGTYGLTASKVDVGTAMKSNIQVSDNGATAVQLTLGTDGGTLVSLSLNYTDGQPMPEPWCYLHSDSGPYKHKAHRSAEGVMTITNIPPGVYTTNVSYWSYSQSEQQVEIKANETVHIEDVLYPAGAIHWTLKTASGAPASGAQVTVTPIETTPPEQPRTGVAPADGKFVMRGLAGGTYQLTAQYNGKVSPPETIAVEAGQNAMKETIVKGW